MLLKCSRCLVLLQARPAAGGPPVHAICNNERVMLTCPASNMYAFDFKSLSPGVNESRGVNQEIDSRAYFITFTYAQAYKNRGRMTIGL